MYDKYCLFSYYSRGTWVYLMSHKTDAIKLIRNFVIMVSKQFGTHVKRILSDNGMEFLSKECTNFMHSQGILHERSCAYTPQQNGVVERKHRHLLEIARAVLFQAQMPLSFWPYSVLIAAFIINRLPSSVLKWRTPFQVLYNKEPDYTRLKPFGCLAYAANVLPMKSKYASRSHIRVFLGYVFGMKGYQLFDLETKQLLISRDVRFLESVFPFAKETLPTSDVPMSMTDDLQRDFDSPPGTTISDLKTHFDPTESHALRRSTRATQKPAWMNNFICEETANQLVVPHVSSQKVAAGKCYPINTYPYTVPTMLTSTYLAFIANISQDTEPTHYSQACTHPAWIEAMNKEFEALESNHTWEITYLPPGKTPIGCKWVYKVKRNLDGSVERFKAQLVAKGYTQVYGVDYLDSFSPVAKLVTVRFFISLATIKGWELHQVDVNNAFLHGNLSQEVYMKLAQGYSKGKPGQVF